MFGIDDAIGAAIGVGTGMLTNAWAGNSADHAMNFSRDQLLVSQDFNSAQAALTRDWQSQMRANQYQTAVQDLEKAGLNPMLAYSQGGAGTLSGATASSSGGSGGVAAPVQNPAPGLGPATAAMLDNIRADTKQKEAGAGLSTAQAAAVPVSMQVMQTQIDSMRTNITKTIQDTKTSAASAAEHEAHATLYTKMLEQADATIAQLRAQTKLTGAQDRETVQRIQSNLPAIEAAYKALKTEIDRKGTLPQATVTGALYTDPILGAAASLLKAFNPLQGLAR